MEIIGTEGMVKIGVEKMASWSDEEETNTGPVLVLGLGPLHHQDPVQGQKVCCPFSSKALQKKLTFYVTNFDTPFLRSQVEEEA